MSRWESTARAPTASRAASWSPQSSARRRRPGAGGGARRGFRGPRRAPLRSISTAAGSAGAGGRGRGLGSLVSRRGSRTESQRGPVRREPASRVTIVCSVSLNPAATCCGIESQTGSGTPGVRLARQEMTATTPRTRPATTTQPSRRTSQTETSRSPSWSSGETGGGSGSSGG